MKKVVLDEMETLYHENYVDCITKLEKLNDEIKEFQEQFLRLKKFKQSLEKEIYKKGLIPTVEIEKGINQVFVEITYKRNKNEKSRK
jgi:hypothetical protein